MSAPVLMDDARARRLGIRTRSRVELLADLHTACTWLGDLAMHGIGESDLPGLERTAEGMRRLVVDLRSLAQGGAA